MRIYQYAQAHKIPSADVSAAAKALGFDKTHAASTLTPEEQQQLDAHFAGTTPATKKAKRGRQPAAPQEPTPEVAALDPAAETANAEVATVAETVVEVLAAVSVDPAAAAAEGAAVAAANPPVRSSVSEGPQPSKVCSYAKLRGVRLEEVQQACESCGITGAEDRHRLIDEVDVARLDGYFGFRPAISPAA